MDKNNKNFQKVLKEVLTEFDISRANLLRYTQTDTLSPNLVETVLYNSPSSIDEKLFFLKNLNGISKDLSNFINLWRVDFKEIWERKYYDYLDTTFRASPIELIQMANLIEDYKKDFEFKLKQFKE